MAQDLCDYCSNPKVKWEYPCRDFQMAAMEGKDHISTGSWLACENCSYFIENNDYDGLIDHVLIEYQRVNGVMTNKSIGVMSALLVAMYEDFKRNRNGERKAYG